MYTILVVDDEKNERMGIEKLIRRYRYDLKILLAENGREALKKFEQHKIDILLTDIKMPFLTGIELIKEVHKRGWNPVCIIYSAYGEFEYAQNAIALGVVQYLLKPLKVQEFQELFERVIAMCKEMDEQQAQSEELRQKLKDVEEDRLYRQLLRYLDSETEEVPQRAEEILGPDPRIPVVLSSYSYRFSRYWENYVEDIKKVFGEDSIIINKDDSQTMILMKGEGFASARKREELCERFISLSREKYQSEIFIVMGSRCRDMSELKGQYDVMKEQLEYQFFMTESTYFLGEESSFVRKESDMLSIHFKKILTCARLKDFAGIKNEFEKAFDYVEKNVGFSSIYIKYNFSEVIKQCCEILQNSEQLIQVVEDIYDARSMVQVRQAVDCLIGILSAEDTSRQEENRVIKLVKQHIHEHYADYTLNVASVADELGLSASYLSTQFKGETGQPLVKYISGYRIEKAKELLATTNMKVGDIAKKVGYLNPSYFIMLFRNHVGCSPAKYREDVPE